MFYLYILNKGKMCYPPFEFSESESEECWQMKKDLLSIGLRSRVRMKKPLQMRLDKPTSRKLKNVFDKPISLKIAWNNEE